jgi:SAM-dependent methyltransferase
MFSHSAELYDAIYHFKDYASEAGKVAALIRAANPDARSVLDAACGTGEHVRWLARQGFEADGLDLDDSLLEVARQKHPSGGFFVADMSEFDLRRRYDAVVCLFSSIAYLVTLDRVRRAIECFRRHLGTSGVLLVEPWFAPGVLDPTRVSRQTGQTADTTVERVSQIDVEGRISRIRFEYRIKSPSGLRYAREEHELGLFTPDEMRDVFEDTGFITRFDPDGLMGRGLWMGQVAA